MRLRSQDRQWFGCGSHHWKKPASWPTPDPGSGLRVKKVPRPHWLCRLSHNLYFCAFFCPSYCFKIFSPFINRKWTHFFIVLFFFFFGMNVAVANSCTTSTIQFGVCREGSQKASAPLLCMFLLWSFWWRTVYLGTGCPWESEAFSAGLNGQQESEQHSQHPQKESEMMFLKGAGCWLLLCSSAILKKVLLPLSLCLPTTHLVLNTFFRPDFVQTQCCSASIKRQFSTQRIKSSC